MILDLKDFELCRHCLSRRTFEEIEIGSNPSERKGSIPNIDRMRLARRRKSIPAYLGKTFILDL